MKHFGSGPVEKIKERLSIEEVISSYIKLEPAGSNLKAKCPFHSEKTPSFFVSPGRGSFYCFGCSASGDIFTFVEKFEGLDFRGSLKLLADKAGVPLEEFSKEETSEKERLYKIMEEATNYFIGNLNTNKEALKYIIERGLEEKTIKEFRIGYANPNWRELYFFLKKKGFSESEIEKAGLIKKTDKGGGNINYYDRFRGRIMFPITDTIGRVIAFSGRVFPEIEGDEKPAKYLNSPDTPIFNKSYVLYGLDKAKESIRKNNFSILVEGQLDLILSQQAGYRNTVASSGTALSESTVTRENAVTALGLVRRLSNNIVLAFDGDKAGFKASLRAGRIAMSLGMDVKTASMPFGFDPADLILKKGKEAWKEAIKNSKHLIEFLMDGVLRESSDIRKAGREIKEKVLPYVNSLDSSIEKMYFIKKISDMTGIPENALKEDLEKVSKESSLDLPSEDKKENSGKILRKDNILRRLLGIVMWQKVQTKPLIDVDFVLKEISETLSLTPSKTVDILKENKEDLIYEAEILYGKEEKIEKNVIDLLNNFKEEHLREELGKKMIELYKAEESKDFERSSILLKEYQELNNKIQNIKKK